MPLLSGRMPAKNNAELRREGRKNERRVLVQSATRFRPNSASVCGRIFRIDSKNLRCRFALSIDLSQYPFDVLCLHLFEVHQTLSSKVDSTVWVIPFGRFVSPIVFPPTRTTVCSSTFFSSRTLTGQS